MAIQFLGADAPASGARAPRMRRSVGQVESASVSRVEPVLASRFEPKVAPRRQVIRYGGQRFDCSREMADIFLKRAREVVESGDEELVPLRHRRGIELLLVSRSTPYSLVVDLDT